MLIYVLRWWPSWISDRHKKHTPCRGPSRIQKCAHLIEHETLGPGLGQIQKCAHLIEHETPGPGLGQIQKCGGVKQIIEIPILPS